MMARGGNPQRGDWTGLTPWELRELQNALVRPALRPNIFKGFSLTDKLVKLDGRKLSPEEIDARLSFYSYSKMLGHALTWCLGHHCGDDCGRDPHSSTPSLWSEGALHKEVRRRLEVNYPSILGGSTGEIYTKNRARIFDGDSFDRWIPDKLFIELVELNLKIFRALMLGTGNHEAAASPERRAIADEVVDQLYYRETDQSPMLMFHPDRLQIRAAVHLIEAIGEVRWVRNAALHPRKIHDASVVIASAELSPLTASAGPSRTGTGAVNMYLRAVEDAIRAGVQYYLVTPTREQSPMAFADAQGAVTSIRNKVPKAAICHLVAPQSNDAVGRIWPSQYLCPPFRFVLYTVDRKDGGAPEQTFYMSRGLSGSGSVSVPASMSTTPEECQKFVSWWNWVKPHCSEAQA
jgi:hypothetical protein